MERELLALPPGPPTSLVRVAMSFVVADTDRLYVRACVRVRPSVRVYVRPCVRPSACVHMRACVRVGVTTGAALPEYAGRGGVSERLAHDA